jgi:hypothetical protein
MTASSSLELAQALACSDAALDPRQLTQTLWPMILGAQVQAVPPFEEDITQQDALKFILLHP